MDTNSLLIGSMSGAALAALLIKRTQSGSTGQLQIVDKTIDEADLQKAFDALDVETRKVLAQIIANTKDLSALNSAVQQLIASSNRSAFDAELRALRLALVSLPNQGTMNQALELMESYNLRLQEMLMTCNESRFRSIGNLVAELMKSLDQAKARSDVHHYPQFLTEQQLVQPGFFSYKEVLQDMSTILSAQIASLQAEKQNLASNLVATIKNMRDLADALSTGFDPVERAVYCPKGSVVHMPAVYKTPAEMVSAHDKASSTLEINLWLVMKLVAGGKIELRQYAQALYGAFVGGTSLSTLSDFPVSSTTSLVPWLAMGSKWFWEARESIVAQSVIIDMNDTNYRGSRLNNLRAYFGETSIEMVGHPLFAARDDIRLLKDVVAPKDFKVNLFVCGIDNELVQCEGHLPMALILSALGVNSTINITPTHLGNNADDAWWLLSSDFHGVPLPLALDAAARRTAIGMFTNLGNYDAQNYGGQAVAGKVGYLGARVDKPLRRLFGSPADGDCCPILYPLPTADIVTIGVVNEDYEAVRVNYDANGNPIAPPAP